MRIGVVSDTHLTHNIQQLPRLLVEGLQGVDLIVHAGDWVELHVVKMLEAIAPVEGVAGNNDGAEIIERFGRTKVLTLAGFQVGLVHGDGYPKTTEERAWEAFRQQPMDLIVFGHSHRPLVKKYSDTLLFNPGSPTDKRHQPRYSYGILELGKNQLEANHYYYDDKS